ncbi:sugar phosphate isomerase/epimerase family protein [Spirosoma utsteinense]|uniref:Sugar phosphate isomerase/epimerase n=1 Tax=Spirosoma utsteinense TaxID=2585773 RepID=A0ABR6W6K5_9BACT|nr:TIM barrel protein [Spirosoma utsteinense]MBC3787524.1 sugar phosphate isomerase/epimerase [Spirosoma utsteinense]MBC3792209.1 sugar phosphate isomerase/epimerase [Spirosoma utsteinense]
MKNQPSRRQFLGTTAALISGTVLGSHKLFGAPALIRSLGEKPNSLIDGVQIGVITYSFRDMPDQSAEATLQYVLDSGISAIELMGGPAESFVGAPKNPVDMKSVFPLMRKRFEKKELTDDEKKQLADLDVAMKAYRAEMTKWRLSAPMNKFEQVRKLYNQAGVKIYGFKPDTFGLQSTDAEIEYGLKAAKLMGANQVTLEHPSNDAHTLRLGKMAEKQGMRVGYHGHEQQTPTFWDTALAQSPGNAINFDLGHYIAAGNLDPLVFLRQKHDRLVSMHIKDRQTSDHGKGNLPWGQGDTPLKQVLQLMRDQKYTFPATVELEYQIPAGSNAVAEVKKCVAYCRTALS